MAHFVYPTVNTGQQSAYPPQTAYVAAAPQAAYATAAPRVAQAYDSYQAVNAAPQYAYATGARVAVSPAATYDQAKAYYQPAQAAVQASHYASADHYQVSRETVRVPVAIVSSAKPTYSPAASYTPHTQRQPPPPKAQPIQVSSAPAASYVYNVTTTAPPTQSYASSYAKPTTPATAPVAYSSYDSALYSAATNYYQQQHKVSGGGVSSVTSCNVGPNSSSVGAATNANAWAGFKKGNLFIRKPAPINKGAPKSTQIHYCDVCKISCAGPLTYKEHLEGQKHKKKEQSMKSGKAATPAPAAAVSRGLHQIRCELCDVTCTGTDAYAAHIRGAKHQKVVKLHQKLGKPIPQPDPQLLVSASAGTGAAGTRVQKPTGAAAMTAAKKVTGATKINFVGGSTLKMLGGKAEEVKDEFSEGAEEMDDSLNMLEETIVAPVGHEYIEEIHEPGKSVSFNCKLCECKFNDPNAKDMHMKGRRHRLQFKKRVDPTLQVDIKPSIRTRKIQEDKLRRQAQKEEQWRRRLEEERWRDEMRMEEQVYWSERRRYEEEMEYYEWQRQQGLTPPLPPRPLQRPRPPAQMRRPDTIDDRHVMAKHNTIYPKEKELEAVQNMVSACEKTLKLVSDHITESDGRKNQIEVGIKSADGKDGEQSVRLLKGVMRVGVLAKGLLLHGDLNVNLVVLCSEKPTRTLLERLADNLPKQLSTVCDQKFEVKRCVEEAAIIVSSEDEMTSSCTITLTSPIMRETNVAEAEAGSFMKDPPDVLDRQKCLDALAALRHAKWFQAKANGLQSCVIVIRILRDLCQRVPTWTPLTEWAMELLVEKCVGSGGTNMTPGDALRRVFECIASGILLPGGPGLYDPCEKDATEAASSLTNQQREEITASAQHALRLIAFRQIHKVLGMDPLPAPRFKPRMFSRNLKRRHTNSQGDGDEGGEKKDKKDEVSMDTSTAKA